jgi:hypothetical protein
MNITIRTIPYDAMRYPTAGDWVFADEHNLQITVAGIGDRRMEALIGVHELIEALLCDRRGITTQAVDAFDKMFEATRKDDDPSEPGDSPLAPYRREHFFATTVERMLAAEMGVDWIEYEERIDAL